MPRLPFNIFLTAAALLLSALLGMSSSVEAQVGGPRLQIHQVDGSAYPTVRAVVSAVGADGAPSVGLTSAQLQPFEGETPIQLTSVSHASDPQQRLGVAIVIDASASMDGAPLDAAKLAAIEFVRSLGPADEAAVFAFNDTVTTVVPFTTNHDALTYGITSLSAGGGARLFDAASAGLYAAGSKNLERGAVVLLTASRNTGSQEGANPVDVARVVHRPVFTVALGAEADEAFLSELSTLTMGELRAAPADGARTAVREIADVLANQYVLTMTGAGSADRQVSELRLIARLGGDTAGAIASFRRGPDPVEAPQSDSGGGSWLTVAVLVTVITLVAAGAAAGLAYGGVRVVRDIRVARHQRAVVAPNQARAAAQPLPRPVGAFRPASVAAAPAMSGVAVAAEALIDASSYAGHGDPDPNTATPPVRITPEQRPTQPDTSARSGSIGSFVEKTPHGRGATYELGSGPVVIGSSERECTIVLPANAEVAPAHVRIWLRDGKYVMHHAGGFRRRTLVGGQPTDWCVLEHGDELQIGPHKLVYVEAGNERPLRL